MFSFCLFCFSLLICSKFAETQLTFEIPEEKENGYLIGNIWISYESSNRPSVNQISASSYAKEKIEIDISSGDVRVRSRIDRDNSAHEELRFYLLPSTIEVLVIVNDINDNEPEFPQALINVQIPETDTTDSTTALGTANDPDEDPYNVKDFEIVSGNVDNTFGLVNDVINDILYSNLQALKPLDREERSHYLLVVRAFDGGDPPLTGGVTVNVTILDANDNKPVFNQSEYSVQVREDVEVGRTVVTVFAEDDDADENGRVTYELRQSMSSEVRDFAIDERTGRIFVDHRLDYETEQSYSLIIVAKDNGSEQQESTAVVTVQVENVNDNAPVIDIIFLNEEAPGRISEDAEMGSYIAIISVSDADMALNPDVDVTLEGASDNFALRVSKNVLYLALQSIDRESQQIYELTVTATDHGDPPLTSQRKITLYVSDANDNPPVFQPASYEVDIEAWAPPGSHVVTVTALDRDVGENAQISYRFEDDPDAFTDWFHLDEMSGLITTARRLDCDVTDNPVLNVIAYDPGTILQSATATVDVRIVNRVRTAPTFDSGFYSVDVAEDSPSSTCVLQVSVVPAASTLQISGLLIACRTRHGG